MGLTEDDYICYWDLQDAMYEKIKKEVDTAAEEK